MRAANYPDTARIHVMHIGRKSEEVIEGRAALADAELLRRQVIEGKTRTVKDHLVLQAELVTALQGLIGPLP